MIAEGKCFLHPRLRRAFSGRRDIHQGTWNQHPNLGKYLNGKSLLRGSRKVVTTSFRESTRTDGQTDKTNKTVTNEKEMILLEGEWKVWARNGLIDAFFLICECSCQHDEIPILLSWIVLEINPSWLSERRVCVSSNSNSLWVSKQQGQLSQK